MSEQRLDQLERRLSELEREIAAIRQEIRKERLVIREPKPVKVDTVIATEATGVNASSGPEAKIALFMERFSGPLDVYARRWTSRRTGKSGWSPATRQGFYSKDTTPKDYLPFTADTVNAHLRRGCDHIGLYVMLPNDTCKLLDCDFDDGTWK